MDSDESRADDADAEDFQEVAAPWGIDEPVPQKLLLAPLLPEKPERRQAVSSSAGPLSGVPLVVQPQAELGPHNAPLAHRPSAEPNPSTAGSSTRPSAPVAAASWLRSWWQMAQEGDEEDNVAVDNGADIPARSGQRSQESTRESDVLRASASAAATTPQAGSDKMRKQLLTCARLLKELQAENSSLSEELRIERQQRLNAAIIAESLRRDNVALRASCRQAPANSVAVAAAGPGNRDVQSPSPRPAVEVSTDNGETDLLRTQKSALEAQLYRSQLALVTIVEELETRLSDCELALTESDRLLTVAKEDNKDMLDFFRTRAPGATQIWVEARVCANANTEKRRKSPKADATDDPE